MLMKNFYVTICSIFFLFMIIMGSVLAISMLHKSGSTDIDLARICEICSFSEKK